MAKQREVQRFLTRLSFAKPRGGEFGITWLELYTLYKAMGHPCPVNNPEARAKARPSMGAQVHAFKIAARRIVQRTVKDDHKQLFACGKKRGLALMRLGISSHAATLNCVVKMDAQ
eukprot:6470441-Karenia_brevis.AAC.1